MGHIPREIHLYTSDECLELCGVEEREKRRFLSRLFIEQVEAWGTNANS